MKALLNSLNRTANTAKISGGGNSHILKCLLTILLLLTLGVGHVWANTTHPVYCAINPSSLGETGVLYLNVHKGTTHDGGVWFLTPMTKIATTISKAATKETKDLYYAEIEYVEVGLQQLEFQIYDAAPPASPRETKVAFSSWKTTSDDWTKPIFDYENGNFTTYPASLAEKTSYVYFDAADWTDAKIQLATGHGLYQGYNELSSHLDNTTIYYAHPTLNWGDAVHIAFVGHKTMFETKDNWLTDMPTWAGHYTGYLHYSLLEGKYHFFRRSAGDDNGTAISFSYNETEEALLSTLNKTQTVQARLKTTGSSYSDASFASWPGIVSVERTYMSSATATTSPSAANMTSATTDAVLTSSITLTASANSGYYFEGWGDASDSNPTDGTAAKTYTITDTKTSYAFFSQAYTLTYAPKGDYSTSTVSVYSVDNYSGATTSGSAIPTGHMITLVATPATGYEVEGWYSDASCETAYTNGSGGVTIEGGNTFKLASLNANSEVYPKFRPKTYTITLVNMEATEAGTASVDVTYNASTNMTSAISKPSKTNYTFDGYWVRNESTLALETQLIDANGSWIKDVTGYTGNDGAGNPTWVHDYAISLYAKWTETPRTITLQVSPSGAGTLSPAGSVSAYIVTPSATITATPNPGWVFKEWQYGTNVGPYKGTGTNNTVQVTASVNGTLTAVFEPRYYLVGGEITGEGDGGSGTSSGMPGWDSYTKPFNVITSSPILATCSLTLGTNKNFYIMVRDKTDGLSYGKSGGISLGDDASVKFENQDNKVLFYSNGGTNYTFKITAVDVNGRPTVSVERPHQMHFAHKRVDIDGDDHNDNLGGTLTATINGESAIDEQWFDYGSDVSWTATAEAGYTLTWYTDNAYSNAMSPQPDASWSDPDITHDENIYAKFTETPTTVNLANDGHGRIQIGGVDKTATTVGVTTTRELTAVPNEGYMFSSWTETAKTDYSTTSTSTNPTTLRGGGSGAASQTLTANFTHRWALKAESDGWGSTEFTIANISTDDSGDVIGYVEINLAANTNYLFTIKDKLNDDMYKIGGTSVLYMNHDNCSNWTFGTGGDRSNCGITTAGKGTYRFSWNITDKTISVTYPAAQLISCGAATENGGSGGSITTIKDEADNDYSNGQYISEGNTITFTATPNDGYEFVGWFSNNEYNAVPVTNVNPWNFTVVAEPVNVYALFAEENVYYFDGNNGTSTDWTTPTNWTRKVVPTTSSHTVRILKPVTVSTGTKVHVANVDIVTGGSFTPAGGSVLTASGQLNIADGGMLIVAGSVKKVTDASAMGTKTPTGYDDLNIGSTLANGNGALVMGSHDGTNKAHVAFATKAKKDGTGHNVNQFIGTPFNDENYIFYNYYGTKIYEFKAAGDGNKGANHEWQRLANDGDMTPFWGYNILTSQTTSPTLWMQGTLNSSVNHTTNLYFKDGDSRTENMLANSWVSPIDITKFQASDFSENVEKTIYIYNAGTVADEVAAGEGGVDASLPGQWIVLPINSMPWTSPTVTVIPSMQAFSVYVSAASQMLTMDYTRLVYDPAVNGTATIVPNRAPRRYTEEETPAVLKMIVAGESGYSDQIVLLSREDFTSGFDNGWDGRKIMGDDAAPQLYTITQDGKMSIDCTPLIEGTLVGFKPGEADPFYTIRFDYDGDETLYLNDLQMQLSTPIDAEHTYSFSAYANDSESRFVISATPIAHTPTDLENAARSEDALATARKVMIDNHLYIIYRGRIYAIDGGIVK